MRRQRIRRLRIGTPGLGACVAVALIALSACSAPEMREAPGTTGDTTADTDTAAPGDVAPDTARGVVAVVGSDPGTRVALRPASGPALYLTGPHRNALDRLSGIEIWVEGTRDRRGMDVQSFAVRAVDGVPAVDGILTAAPDGAIFLTPAGQEPRRVMHPPARLRDMVGDRVWIAGPLDQAPVAFGWIE